MPSPEVETATTVMRGMSTPVAMKPVITGMKDSPEAAPSKGGKMRLPAPKNRAKSIRPVGTMVPTAVRLDGWVMVLVGFSSRMRRQCDVRELFGRRGVRLSGYGDPSGDGGRPGQQHGAVLCQGVVAHVHPDLSTGHEEPVVLGGARAGPAV